MSFRVRKYSWQLAPSSVQEIRQQVFIDEQGVPADEEWDDTDEIADHYLAVSHDNRPAGVARLFPSVTDTAHIGRMAVLPEFRGRGVGARLLEHMVREAAGQYQDLYLSAQAYAIPFYQRCGFHVCSEPYDDVGIPHVDMRCLAPRQVSDQLSQRATPMVLGQDEERWLVNTEADLVANLDSLANQARKQLWLYDRELEHDLYDRLRFREIVSALARGHRHCDIRLLVHDDRPLVKKRHQIVELMKRLPSKIELRLVNQDYPIEDYPFLLAERQGVLVRHEFDKPHGYAQFASARRNKLLSESFLRMWENATPSKEFRQLSI
ncbi:GNAT family N-acetyltransferase [Marinobacter xestospongiae]|uniref:GNAT family N-acetyltransferase n=1 Tax=Marinobacter xestospongiae TaxID=994319 RepID=A0ABU3VXQ4_9GAMM|nr:GNAT family N-acetyltransferase [Marinobacter xestospongiae]MDV2079068.1 GNAT family N-acetyltransferase [Marinobacter xestospongiae]